MAPVEMLFCAKCRDVVEQRTIGKWSTSQVSYVCAKGHKNRVGSTATVSNKRNKKKYWFKGLGTASKRLQRSGRKRVHIRIGR